MIDANDPKLTAYVLGELDDDQRAEVEATLAQSEQLRNVVSEIRETTTLMAAELGTATSAALSDEQRVAIVEQYEQQSGVTTNDDSPAPHDLHADDASITPLSTRAAGFSPRGASESKAKRNPWRIWLPLSAAASLILVAGAYYTLLPSLSSNRELATLVAGIDGNGQPQAFLPKGQKKQNRTSIARKPLGNQQFNLAAKAGADLRTNDSATSHTQNVEATVANSKDAKTRTYFLMQAKAGEAQKAIQSQMNGDTAFYAGGMAVIVNNNNASAAANQPSSPTTSKRFLSDPTLKSRMYDAHDKINEPLLVNSDGNTVQTIGSSDSTSHLELKADAASGSYLDPSYRPSYIAPYGSTARNKAGTNTVARRRARRSQRLARTKSISPTIPAASGQLVVGKSSSAYSKTMSTIRQLKPNNEPGIIGVREIPNSNEPYERLPENPFLMAGQHPLSTFSIDVDTASYANVRRMLNQSTLPPPGAVRIEELVNYFSYDYPLPEGDDPFSVNVEIAECPWDSSHRLARIGIKGMEYTEEERPASNLVFLLDVSGSMSSYNKLPLLKKSLGLLIERLSDYDSVAIVVYAGATGLTLPATMCDDKAAILASLDYLNAGGSTNGGAGIQLAYDIASENFIEGGNNRVILATDGDFNVGTTSRTALLSLIEEKAQTGVFLSVLGFGMGNLKDSTLEMLADKGNGNYAYIDTLNEAQKVLVDDMTGTLITIAKDVKIQVEFNPAQVSAYRLVGYENRMLAAKDFNDDTKDAGEIGAGHTVTALYEIVPVGVEIAESTVDPLKYQQVEQADLATAAFTGEMMTVKLRYKAPDGEVSSLIEMPIVDEEMTLRDASNDFAFAAAVASFGMNLRQSQHIGEFDYNACYDLAESGINDDPFGYRAEFLTLISKAITLSDRVR